MKRSRGFTIVELVIVIAVIAILAAITVVAYNGIQSRAKDAAIRSGADQFEKAMQIWSSQVGQLPKGGWGSTAAVSGYNCPDGDGGWTYSGAYTCSIEDILVSKNLIPSGFTKSLPKNTAYNASVTDGRYTLMFYRCPSSPGSYALYYYLNNPTSQDTADVAAVEAAGCPTSPRTNYSMKGAKLIKLL